MDAIVGMEGEGPAGGTPRQVGAVIASADSVALDVIASSMAGLDPMEVYSNKAAARRGLGPSSADEVEVVGEDWHALAPEGFKLPATRSVGHDADVARQANARLDHVATLPRSSQGDCTRCRKCQESCPVAAIVVGDGGPVFDHGRASAATAARSCARHRLSA